MDAIPDPTGRTPYLSPSKKPIEAGFKGFWKDYPNIENMVKELGLQENKIFTDYTNSSFYSPFGLEATAPVFSKTTFPQLPSPIGQIAASAALFERLPLQDRASMVGLLYAMLDLYRDEETYAAYDRMTAHELFIKMKLSKRLVDDFIRPTLLIGLFKAPEELSAAVSMELLYFYALAHQNSFDVRWIKQSSISSAIFSPLCTYLESKYDLEIKGGCRVSGLEIDDSKASATSVKSLRYSQSQNQESTLSDIDGVILALGSKGLSNVMRGSPSLAVRSPELTAAASLGSIDVISCRLWLDTIVPTRTPANVFSRFDELRGAGGTFFMLDQLQGESDGVGMDGLWGGDNSTRGSVVAVDFYNAGALLPLSDKDLIATIIEKLLPGAVPKFR